MNFSKNFKVSIAIAGILTLVEAYGQYLLYKYHISKTTSPNILYLIAPVILSAGSVILLEFAYDYTSMGIIEVLWNAGMNTVIPLLGYIVFNQQIKPIGIFGIILTTIGSLMLGVG
jgi:multidrug transporter EmrE-like cation transporter